MNTKTRDWEKAAEKAQEMSNRTGATLYCFREWDGTLSIEIDYPKSGIQFQTFKPES